MRKRPTNTHCSNPFLLLKGYCATATFTWSVYSCMVFSILSHTLTYFLKYELFEWHSLPTLCQFIFLLYIFISSVMKQKCLISSKLNLPFNHTEVRPQVCFILAAVYCFGPVSNYSGKLLWAQLIEVIKRLHAGDKSWFLQSQPSRLRAKILKGKGECMEMVLEALQRTQLEDTSENKNNISLSVAYSEPKLT